MARNRKKNNIGISKSDAFSGAYGKKRIVPSINELRHLINLVSKEFNKYIDAEFQYFDDIFASHDLLLLLTSLYLQIWIFHFSKIVTEIKNKVINDPHEWDYSIDMLRVLADILLEEVHGEDLIFVPTKSFTHYPWSKRLFETVNKIKKTSIKQRRKRFHKIKNYALELYSKCEKLLKLPSDEIFEKFDLNKKENLRWNAAILISFADMVTQEDVLKEKLFFMKSKAIEINDDALVGLIDETIELLQHSSAESLEGTIKGVSLEELSPQQRELLEDLMDATKDIANRELDFKYIKEHPNNFIQAFSVLIAGIDNAITITNIFFPKEAIDELSIEESYFQISWKELKDFFQFKDRRNIRQKIENCSEKKLKAVVQEAAIAGMTFILGKRVEYNLSDVFLVLPKKIDVDFKRLNIKERSGLSKVWREKFAILLREELVLRAEIAGITIAEVDISLEEQYGS